MEHKLSDLKNGLIIGILIYLFGALLTYLVHKLTGWSYGHAPPVSFLVIILTYIVGIIRSIFNKANLSINYKKNRNKGELIIHLTILGLTFGLILLEIIF
jgi:H+/Cl- antiporter ClcA